jgi:hypothetical protein
MYFSLRPQIISSRDSLVLSEEGASSLGDCYSSTYRLSDQVAARLLPGSIATNASYLSPYFDGYAGAVPLFFHGHTLVNWGLFAAPHHPLFLELLANIVEVIRSEYEHTPVVMTTKWDVRWKAVMCSTNFILTYTLRDMLLRGRISDDLLPRVLTRDFAVYRGKAKAIWTGGDPTHYMKVGWVSSSF